VTLNNSFLILLAAAAGALLGVIFFGGLWWTLRRAFPSKRPALWVGVSLLFRMLTTSAGFVFVSAGDWRRLLSCLLGFLAARWLILRLTPRLSQGAAATGEVQVTGSVQVSGDAAVKPS
jgi:F1F0 ATPase subunit 2